MQIYFVNGHDKYVGLLICRIAGEHCGLVDEQCPPPA